MLHKSSNMENNLKVYNGEAPIGAGGKKTTMVLGIFSTNGRKYHDRRSYIRDTYLAIDDPRICKLSEYKRQVEENPYSVICQVPYTFVIGAGGKDRPFDHGDDEPLALETDPDGHVDPEGDCLYLNIKESMEEGKSPSFLKWGASIATDYHIDYFAKIDDDTVMAPLLLFQFLQDDLPPVPYNRRFYGGAGWASHARAFVYAAGQFYFVSSDLANYIGFQQTPEERRKLMHSRHTEDGDMGSFVFSHPRPVKFVNLSHYKFWHHPGKTEDKFRRLWENNIGALPTRGELMPYWHLCPAWAKGKGL